MSPRYLIAWGLIPISSLVAVVVIGWRAATAHAGADRDLRELGLVARQAGELVALRGTARPASPSGQDGRSSSLASRIGAVLASSGLPAVTLSGLAPEPPVMVSGRDGGWANRKERATLTLAGLTLPQLGAFLDAWRRAEPGWTVATIDVGPTGAGETGPAGGDLPLRIVLVLESAAQSGPRGDRP